MKIMENKKIFGKINIFDIIILLVVLIVAVLLFMFLRNTNETTSTAQEKIYTIKLEKLVAGTSNNIKQGDKIYDNEINSFIGEVVSVEKKDYTKVIENYETNEYVEAVVEDYENAILEIKVGLNDSGSDLKTSSDYIIKVGKQVFLRGPNYAGSGYIIQIER